MFIAKTYETIAIELFESFGLVTIKREKAYNALNRQVLKELEDLFSHIDREDHSFSLRGIILTGEGEKAFVAGADIKEMAPLNSEEAQNFSLLGHRVMSLIEGLKIPTVAAINGHALGGGLELAMACDFILSVPHAALGMPEVNLGLIPGFGGTQRLALRVGFARAKHLIFSGGKFSSEQAANWGLITQLFDTKVALIEGAKDLLRSMAEGSPQAIAQAKMSIHKGLDVGLNEALKHEAELFGALFGTENMLEGTQAFIEKRKAHFKGQNNDLK